MAETPSATRERRRVIVEPSTSSLDLSACAQEPIHIPGTIQPHGFLLVLAPDFTVKHVSANVERLNGQPVATLCGAPISAILGDAQAERFIAVLRLGDFAAFNPTRFVLHNDGIDKEVECTVHRSQGGLIVELEPVDASIEHTPVDLYAHVRNPIARMEEAVDVETLATVAARAVFSISGFDRAMVYRFDEEWNGEVIAEAMSASVPVAYLGLHFPASDIPLQARLLYVKNPLRLIPDVDYEASPIVPEFDPKTRLSIDLSQAILRSVSPYHVEYLQNMGVRATLTISIIIGGRLWGLIACHNYSARRLDYGMRAVCELVGRMLAWRIDAILETASLQEELRANKLVNAYGTGLNDTSDFAAGLVAESRGLLDLFNAQGLVVCLNGTIWRVGATPRTDIVVSQIAAALHERAADGVATSYNLGPELPSAVEDAEIASGALLLTLSDLGDEYVLCFRQEMIETVHWGGDPHKPVTTFPGGIRPRRSFESWRETMRGRSLRWSTNDTAAAHGLRERILERRQTVERNLSEERNRYLAQNDVLTQLPNRSSFHVALVRKVGDAQREGRQLAVLFIDVDHLRLFNDQFGHATGDLILQAAAARIAGCVRHNDVVARLGGDEFVVILPDIVSERDADLVAEKVLAAVAEPFVAPGTPELRFTASVGIALYPKDALDAETLLRQADLAMYRAKERGRNDFRHFGSGDTLPTYDRLAFEQRIGHGLTWNEFVPFYQPIVSARSGDLLGMEALARWNHPELGLLLPARFIALAEESQLIVTLGQAMLHAACTDCARWRLLPGKHDLRVSVNVSARQFREDDFAESVGSILAQTGLVPNGLQLELTESVLIGNEHYAMKTLQALADAGVSVAIDDFGTGYSSLSYLRHLRVDALKIDQSFVADLRTRPDDTAIIRAIIAMAHSLKLDVVAEGVETLEQLDFLRAAGCDTIQGFFIGKPLAYAAAIAFIENFESAASGKRNDSSP